MMIVSTVASAISILKETFNLTPQEVTILIEAIYQHLILFGNRRIMDEAQRNRINQR